MKRFHGGFVLLVLAAGLGRAVAAAPTAGPAEPGNPRPDARGEVWEVDTGASTAGFTLRATLHTVEGTGGRVSGRFIRDAGAGADGDALGGEILIEAGSLTTDNERRDEKMRRETLAIAEHPLIRFRPVRARPSGAGAGASEGTFAMTLDGSLTIRGTSRDVSIPVTVRRTGGRVVVDGQVGIDFTDWGVPDPSVFLLRVKKEMTVRFHLEAEASGPAGEPPG